MQQKWHNNHKNDGTKIECEILFTYHDNEFEKDYVIFKVKSSGELSAATYNPNDGDHGELGPVSSDEEWEMLEEVLNDYYEQQQNNSSCDSCQGCSCSSCDGGCGCEENDEK